MQHRFDRSYYVAKLARNRELADEAQMPHVREAHLRLADFYSTALEAVEVMEQAGKDHIESAEDTFSASVA